MPLWAATRWTTKPTASASARPGWPTRLTSARATTSLPSVWVSRCSGRPCWRCARTAPTPWPWPSCVARTTRCVRPARRGLVPPRPMPWRRRVRRPCRSRWANAWCTKSGHWPAARRVSSTCACRPCAAASWSSAPRGLVRTGRCCGGKTRGATNRAWRRAQAGCTGSVCCSRTWRWATCSLVRSSGVRVGAAAACAAR